MPMLGAHGAGVAGVALSPLSPLLCPHLPLLRTLPLIYQGGTVRGGGKHSIVTGRLLAGV